MRTIAGTMTLHEALEAELAEFKHTEAVLTFQSGFTANTGVIPTITGETDLIVSDELNHASIIDGMRLSKAPRKVYPARGRRRRCGTILREARERGPATGTASPTGSILVVTDGVFSMDGDIAPLPGIVEAAEAYGAAVMVDDAHASGVLGRDGRGTVDHFGLHGRVAIQVGTLSKAVGVLGGYVAGIAGAARHPDPARPAVPLLDVAIRRPSPPPAARRSGSCARSRSCIERLWANTRRFKAELARLGFDIGRVRDADHAGHRGRLGDRRSASPTGCSRRACSRTSVVFPTVALDRARIRTIVTAAHTDEHARPGARRLRPRRAASSGVIAG